MRQKMHWRVLVILFCALVFFFALHAKTAVYNNAPPAKQTASTASKLWLSGQKMEVQSIDSTGGVVFWMALLYLFGLCLVQTPVLQRALVIPAVRNLPLWEVHRFLRPPPQIS
jgi:hypothetical protein